MKRLSFLLLIAVAGSSTGCAYIDKLTGKPTGPASSPSSSSGTGNSSASAVSNTTAEAPEAATPNALPPKLNEWIENRYSASPGGLKNMHTLFGMSTSAFEANWQAYEQRKREVDAAISAADGAKPKKAIEILGKVVTPLALSEDGKLLLRRQLVEAIDAEVPALEKMATLAVRAGKPELLYPIMDSLSERRRVGEREREQWLWYGFRNERTLSGLGVGSSRETVKFIEAIQRDVAAAVVDGARLAEGIDKTLTQYGVVPVQLYEHKSARPGQWIRATVRSPKLSGRKVSVNFEQVEKIPYNCRDTNKIVGINPDTGRWIYEYKCQHKQKRVSFRVAGTAAAEIPAWVGELEKNYRSATFVAKVTKAGPSWKLTQLTFVRRTYAASTGAGYHFRLNAGEGTDETGTVKSWSR